MRAFGLIGHGSALRRVGLGCALVAGVLALACAAVAGAATPGWRLLAVTGPTNLPPVSSEIQKVAVDAEGGTFTLTYDGQTTDPLPSDATAGQLLAAIESLSSVVGSGGSVTVSGGPGDVDATHPYFVRFEGALGGVDLPPMSADGGQLLPVGGSSVDVSTREDGGMPGKGEIAINATNVGGAATTSAPIVIDFELPPGITATPSAECSVLGQDVTCSRVASVQSGQTTASFMVPVTVGPGAPATAMSQVSVAGGGAAGTDSTELTIVVAPAAAPPGIQALWAGAFDSDGNPSVQAGAHPEVAGAAFRLNTILSPAGRIIPAGDVKDVPVTLPPGFIGNPLVTARCPQSELGSSLCEDATVGIASPAIQNFDGGNEVSGLLPLLNGIPPTGYAAEFTFKIAEAKASVLGTVRSDEDFGVTVTAPNIANQYKVYGAFTVLEGAPADAGGKAFLTNPTDCANEALVAPLTTISANSWQAIALFDTKTVALPPVTGCDQLEFDPSFTFRPSTGQAASVTAATAELSLPQEGMLDPQQLASPHLDRSVVTLPRGMVLNPAAAAGLESCSTDEVGLKGTGFAMPNPIRFDLDPVACPDAAKIGVAEVSSPAIEDPLEGTIYLASQGDNPFGSLLAMYIVIDDEKTGIVAKLPGEVVPDPATGQLTAIFDHNPQLPFSSLKLTFRGGGPRSTMATPDVCGDYTTTGSFTPWSAPESGPPAGTSDSFTIDQGIGGGASCPRTKEQRPFSLGFEAGSTNPVAGAHSPFTLRVTRPDGNQELDRISVQTPPGFAATLKGVAVCPDAQLAQALSRNRPGHGADELASPSCPASSQVGTTTIGAGVGSQPYYVRTGKVYRTGVYRGAKQSLTFIVPAVAGPFDLGVQVVRTALQVNPTTAQITAESDPIPQILQGIPLQIRDVRVDIDRPGFALNPTNCEELGVNAQVTGGSGASQALANRFQVDGCRNLGFRPKLQLTYRGQTKRSGNPALRAVLTQPAGQANIGRTVVLLPVGSQIDNAHVSNPCTRDQYAANACPPGSILGTATAWSPLLDEPLSGNVYFRSNGGARELPDIVASLKGEVDVELVGFIDAVQNRKAGTSRVRNTFAVVPDAPVSRFVLNLKGGKVGLIENGKNLCRQVNRATVTMAAHNRRALTTRPAVKTSCKRKAKQKRR